MNHKYKTNRKEFFVDRVERGVVLRVLLGKELYGMVLQYMGIVFGFQSNKQKVPGCGVT